MELLQEILKADEENIDTIIQQAIERADFNSEKIDKLGFLDYKKTNHLFKGFIPLNTRIKYSNLSIEDYGMETTDYMYEFAHFIKKYNIGTKGALIHYLENYINYYFGRPGQEDREEIFNAIAWRTTKTDEEFFEALKNNKLGDLKYKGAAECTERGAMAQQILNLFGIECYYCMGCVDLGNFQEGHCFNIVKRKKDYAVLDYSCPVGVYGKDGSFKGAYPFVGILTNEEFFEFANNRLVKSFENYEYVDGKRITTEGERAYVVGEFEIDKKKLKAISELSKEVIDEIKDVELEDNVIAQQKKLQNPRDKIL